MKKLRATKNEHLLILPAYQVLPYTTRKHPAYRTYVVNGQRHEVLMRSSRFKLFLKNPTCVCCGLKGSLMVLDIHKGHSTPHFNLYGKKNKKLILFTRDHMQPKSKGGDNNIWNYQTMCSRCNSRKRNREITVEELREEIRKNPTVKTNRQKAAEKLACRIRFNGRRIHYHKLIEGIGFYLNKSNQEAPTFEVCREIVKHRAHALWKAAGQPRRRDLEFWYTAEKELFGGLTGGGYKTYICDMEDKRNRGFYRFYTVIVVHPEHVDLPAKMTV